MNHYVSDVFKRIGSFFMSNFIGVILLLGIAIIDYGFFKINDTAGIFAIGASLIVISVLFAREGGG